MANKNPRFIDCLNIAHDRIFSHFTSYEIVICRAKNHNCPKEIWVNIGSGNGLVPDGTKPLPEPMLTYHQ